MQYYSRSGYSMPFVTNPGYSPIAQGSLEYLLAKSEPTAFFEPKYAKEYTLSTSPYEKSTYDFSPKLHKTYHFPVESFLNENRKQTEKVSDDLSILPLIEEAFLSTTSNPLPANISIKICSKSELKQFHSQFGQWSEGIQGFVIPGKVNRIFVKAGQLDEVMLILGHEIGHIHTNQLPNIHDEEAKAFSFSIEWANKIREHNIGNLKENIKEEFVFSPARNGLHDLAFFFVKHLMRKNQEPMQIHNNLSKGYLSFFDLYFG